MNWIPDTVEDVLLNKMPYEADIWSAVYIAPNSTVTLYDIKHLRPGLIVHFSGFPYLVISVDYSANTFIVAGDVSTETSVTLPKPKFFHGSQMAVNHELSRIKNPLSKLPIVWMLEPLTRSGTSNGSEGNPDYQEASSRLFFLDAANYADWTTDEYYEEAHTPMGRLSEWFYWFVDSKMPKGIRTNGAFSITPYGPFGTTSERGQIDSIFSERLAGIELVADFIFKDCQSYKGLNKVQPPTAKGLQYGLQAVLG